MSRIDTFVSQVENHEALVNEALKDLQQATARARVQLKRVREDGERLRRQLAEQREQAERWRERAKGSVDDDSRAVECLRRERATRRSVDELERRFEEHERTEQQLVKDVRSLDVRLATMKDQRNLMRTRQSRAEALGVVQGSAVNLTSDIDEMFDRWEMRVTEAESVGDVALSTEDSFESEYTNQEEQAELRAELEALRRENDE
jgi:phage shock protein A